jgi:hypothetical protein
MKSEQLTPPPDLPPPVPPPEPQTLRNLGARLAWILPALPAVAQLGLMLYAIAGRIAYPYDLEWMEGGLLGHAARIGDRQGIYVEPSVDFIPYLYTPLYPALIALFGGVFGVSYLLGRALSVLALIGLLALMLGAIVRQRDATRRAAWAGGAAAVGLFSAAYPWFEGWYDLVRADTLFLCMAVGGLLGVHAWARIPGDAGRRRIGAVAAILALSFFCKQTGVFYVAAGGVALLFLSWRKLPIYIAVTGLMGLGGVWLFDRASGGWFWTYVFEVHQSHDFNRDRFESSFGNILGHFPLMTAVIAGATAAVLVTRMVTGKRPPGSGALLYWTPIFALSCVVGATGWATQWAHFNAYMPALATGSIAAGAAVPALVGATTVWRRGPAWWPSLAGVAVACALGAQLLLAWWQPARFIPSDADRAAGDALVARLRQVDGDVFMPYHPWYPVLAGKPLYTHRMGLLDVGGSKWPVGGLREAFRNHSFAEVVLDDRPVGVELAGLRESYRMDDYLPPDESPTTYSGAPVSPRSVWVPAKPLPVPDGAQVLFDFETGHLTGWKTEGKAWGKHPAAGPIGNQGAVRRYGGRYFVSSYHGGDEAVGTLSSPEFVLSGSRMTMRISGGKKEATLRAELWVDGVPEKIATGNDSEGMDEVMWSVAPYSGQSAQIVLVDEDKGAWGHLNLDEIWIWD